MGFFRKSGVGLSTVILTTLIFLAVMSFAFSQVTSPEFLKPVASEMISQQMTQNNGQDFGQAYDGFIQECNSGGKDRVQIPLEEFSKTIEMRCDELKAAGKDGFMGLFSGKVVDAVFLDAYNSSICSGQDCIGIALNAKDPMQRISAIMNKNFNDYMKGLSAKFAIGAAIFAALILMLASGIAGRFLALGYPLTMAGLPYIGILLLGTKLEEMFPSAILFLMRGIIDKLSSIFLMLLISGIVLLVIGFVLKFSLKEGKKNGAEEKKGKK